MSTKNWLFTCFYTGQEQHDEYLLALQLLSEDPQCTYLIVGREIAPSTGATHFQGFVCFNRRIAFAVVQRLLPPCHLTRARGSPIQNRTYCAKDGDFEEFGSLSAGQGARSDLESFRDWLLELERQPTERELFLLFPGIFLRYHRCARAAISAVVPDPVLRTGSLRPWQEVLLGSLNLPADDRTIHFVVDTVGGQGKSWFAGYLFSHVAGVQLLGPGTRADLAFMVDEMKKIFIFNIPRGSMEFLHYGLLEQLKDRMVLSTKYESRMKILLDVPHVLVFSNESPDMAKMSADRFLVTDLG